MKRNVFYSVLVSFCLLAASSCTKADDASSPKANKKVANPTSSAFDRFIDKPGDLLSEADAATICGNPENAEYEVGNLTGSMAQYNKVSYSWDGGRMQKLSMGNMEMDVENPYTLSVGMPTEVKTYGREDSIALAFENAHRTLTPEQAQQAKKAIDEQFSKEAEKRGLDVGEQEQDLATGMTEGLLSQALKMTYERVDGLGDAAYWNPQSRQMDVLEGNRYIPITADISDDVEKCKEAAIAVAKLILNP